MALGLIGAGNMARALARGWGEAVLCSDAGSGRAGRLVAEVGGEALSSNAEVAERADLLVLCHKPAQLEAVAAEVAGRAPVVVSVLGATSLQDLQGAYPGAAVLRTMPNTAVEVRAGVTCMCPGAEVAPEIVERVRVLFGRLGHVIDLPERLMDVATGTSGVAPAYAALIAEAQIDAAVKHGLPSAVAGQLVVESLAGSAALLKARGFDTLAVRREVTSPGGSTARGLAALERGGLRSAFVDALEAVMAVRR
ncbi:MAG TPA: pyrroline-5-carboxylate reductase [Solirubrobacteraceae bacterium]|jgi:pyrroline-5-carboxylate reductase|nr:pyrroline-5-carboxylate reductase [Solirubrobacteraceae bacterium]